MPSHAAYGLRFKELDIVIVDDSRAILSILQSMLINFDVANVRCFGDGQEAFAEMQRKAPDLLITDWQMTPWDGCDLVAMMRHMSMRPLCFVPALRRRRNSSTKP